MHHRWIKLQWLMWQLLRRAIRFALHHSVMSIGKRRRVTWIIKSRVSQVVAGTLEQMTRINTSKSASLSPDKSSRLPFKEELINQSGLHHSSCSTQMMASTGTSMTTKGFSSATQTRALSWRTVFPLLWLLEPWGSFLSNGSTIFPWELRSTSSPPDWIQLQ